MYDFPQVEKFIQEQALKDTSKECCGLLSQDGDDMTAIPCENISETPDLSFVISPFDVARHRKTHNVIGYYHSHLKGQPSTHKKYDRLVSEKLKMVSLIYNVDTEQFSTYVPKLKHVPYTGRPFIPGIFDCFTLVQDYYKHDLNIDLIDPAESVENIYKAKEGKPYDERLREYYEKWDFSDPDELKNIINLRYTISNFIEIKDKIKNKFWVLDHFLGHGFKEATGGLRKGDIILLNLDIYGVEPDYPSHCVVFIGRGDVLHHPIGSRSRIAKYGKFYQEKTCHKLRYK